MLLNQALYYLTILAWITAAGFVAILFIRTWQAEGFSEAGHRVFSTRMFYGLLLFAVGVTLLANSLVFIQPQEAGVVISLILPRGYRDRPLGSGLNLVAPLVTQVYRYPIYWQTYTMSSRPGEGQREGDDAVAARTSDGQEVFLDLSLIYAIDPAQVVNVHITWQDRYAEHLIRPLLRGVLRTEIAKFTALELNSSERTEFQDAVTAQLLSKLNRNGFMMQEFLLRRLEFSPEFTEAIEEKQIAEQRMITSGYRAEQVRILADGEAAALRELGDALRENPEVIELRYVDKLSPNISVLLLPSNAPFILPFPTGIFSSTAATPTLTPTPSPTPTQ